eukprot:scaffold302719_cov32-Tisochrysis_lutea.AAC.5
MWPSGPPPQRASGRSASRTGGCPKPNNRQPGRVRKGGEGLLKHSLHVQERRSLCRTRVRGGRLGRTLSRQAGAAHHLSVTLL